MAIGKSRFGVRKTVRIGGREIEVVPLTFEMKEKLKKRGFRPVRFGSGCGWF